MAGRLREGYSVGFGERLSYGVYFFGQNIFYGLVAFNVQTLFSDVGITAASVGVILLATKVWDAVNDPIFGVVIDKVRFRRGRFVPWLRISLPLIAVSSAFIFALPQGGSPAAKVVWAVITYVAWDMSYTLCDVPIFVLPTSMTGNIKERTGILALGRYLGIIGIMATMMAVPVIQGRIGWLGTGLVLSVAGAALMLPICFAVKERHIVRPEKELSLSEMFSYVAGNRYLLLFYVCMLVNNITNFGMTVTIFFARYNLGNQDLAALLTMMTALPTLVIGIFVPLVCRRIDKFHVYVFSVLAAAAVGVLRFFAGYANMPLFFSLAFVSGLLTGVSGILGFMFTPDCIEYGTFHTGQRAEGSAASIQTFFTKLMGSITGPVAMFILAALGFQSGNAAAQPESAIRGIWLCMTVFPSVGMVAAGLLLLRFYRLRDRDVQVMAEYNSGRIGEEEANSRLAGRYGPAAKLVKMSVEGEKVPASS